MDAIKLYRIARRLYLFNNIICRKCAGIISKINYYLHNSYIPHTAVIGKGTSFGYGGIGVVIHSKSIIGDNCVIGQNVTIGGREGHGGPPVIGNNVFISTGACLIGDFIVGDNSVIGANAVVINDVKPNSVVAGVPAKIIRLNVPNED